MTFINFNISTKKTSKYVEQKHIDLWQKWMFLTHCYQYIQIPSSKIKQNKIRTKKRISIITDKVELIEYANFSILKVEHSSSFIK